jgi:hypothetical protein
MSIRKILERLLGSQERTSPEHSQRPTALAQVQAEFEAAERELRETQRKRKAAGRGMMTSEEVAAAQRVHALQHRLIQVRAASAPGGGAPGLLNLMEVEEIAEIGIDGAERLYVKPVSRDFSHIYRTAMEVHWSPEGKSLYAPKPREWSYLKWYGQILGAAKDEYRVSLVITENTEWVGIGDDLKNEIVQHAAAEA